MLFLPVIPHVGIGPLKLGMSPEQILVTINQFRYNGPGQINQKF